MVTTCVYLYGFTRALRGQTPDVTGLDGQCAVGCLDIGEVGALYSELPASEFDASSLADDPPDPDWVVPRACRHEQVLEIVMRRSPVLPTRFGAVFTSMDSLAAFLVDHYQAILHFLNEASGKEEWSLSLIGSLERAAEQLLETEPGLVEQFERLSRSPGTRYFEEKRLRAQARDRAKAASRQFAASFEAALQRPGWNIRRLPPRATSDSTSEVLIRLAVLIPSTEVGCLVDQIEQLTQAPGALGLKVERSGPWPPSHFCPTLEMTTT